MIKERDVTTLKMPFPDISAGLALSPHMYICYESGQSKKMFKVQSLKPHHIMHMPANNYIIEEKDIQRNPFNKKSMIDLDKYFFLERVRIKEWVLTKTRRDICADLYDKIQEGTEDLSICREQKMNVDEIIILNKAVSKIKK